MSVRLTSAMGVALATFAVLMLPTAAFSEEPTVTVSSSAAPLEEPLLDTSDSGIQVPDLPETITTAEMKEITASDGVLDIDQPVGELNAAIPDAGMGLDMPEGEAAGVPAAEASRAGATATAAAYLPSAMSVSVKPAVYAALGGDRCRLDPGNMWKRTSGYGYKYGTVGSKPRLLECTPGVVKTGVHSDVYRWSGVNWVKVAGTFNSYGTGNMQQLSVQYVCANLTDRYFEVITTGWGTNSRGQTGVGRDSTGSYRLQCG
ncbi:hypothetical protein ACFZA2_08830 [Microbacterium sp. NPDC007973]|uniref:hypothetical protein n=1 Tax=Microbacterium sp. NPDC007973 TaxID=3364182 RepID=UPI0036E2A3BD